MYSVVFYPLTVGEGERTCVPGAQEFLLEVVILILVKVVFRHDWESVWCLLSGVLTDKVAVTAELGLVCW